MKLEKGIIASSQLIFLIVGFTFGSSTIISPTMGAKHDAWLAIIAGYSEALFFAFVYITLALRFPGKNLVQFNDIIFGPYLGKIISLSYLLFFLHLASLVLWDFGEFLSTIMPETPMTVFLTLIALICAYAVRHGIETISHCSLILVPVAVIIVLITFVLLLKDMDFNHFLPIFDVPWKEFLWAAHSAATFPFGETVVFLMIFSSLNIAAQAKRSTFIALTITAIVLVLVQVRNTAVLGVPEFNFPFPSFLAVRAINIGDILTRLESIVALNFITMGFLEVSIAYYAVVLGTAQLLKLRSYLPLIIPIGIILVNISIMQFDSLIEGLHFAEKISPVYKIPFVIGLPLISLIVAIIRGVPKKPGRKSNHK